MHEIKAVWCVAHPGLRAQSSTSNWDMASSRSSLPIPRTGPPPCPKSDNCHGSSSQALPIALPR